MLLLDIIVDYPRRRRVIDTLIRRRAEPADTVGQPLPVDTACQTPADADSLSAAQAMFHSSAPGDDSSMMLWAVAVVLLVLALCCFLALAYRRRLALAK